MGKKQKLNGGRGPRKKTELLVIDGQPSTLTDGFVHISKRLEELEVVVARDRKEILEKVGHCEKMIYAVRSDVVSNYDENIELVNSITESFAQIKKYLKKPWYERNPKTL